MVINIVFTILVFIYIMKLRLKMNKTKDLSINKPNVKECLKEACFEVKDMINGKAKENSIDVLYKDIERWKKEENA